MNTEHTWMEEGVVVAPPAWYKRPNRYGSVPDLDDEELASPDELERAVRKQEWGPILLLPRPKAVSHRLAWDWSADVDFNAFASVDFERTQPGFDRARYKADRLREQLKDVLIMIDIIRARIPGPAKYKVLKYVRMGVIDVDDIRHWDLWQLAKHVLRALRLKQEIARLREQSRHRRQQRCERWLESLG